MYNNGFGGNQFAPNNYGMQNFTPRQQFSYPQEKMSGLSYASEDEVRGYFLNPNTQIFAIDKEKPVFYIKTADNLGRSTVTKYRFEQIFDDTLPQQPKENYLTKDDLKDIVRRNEFEELAKTLQEQYQSLEQKLKPKGVQNEQQSTHS